MQNKLVGMAYEIMRLRILLACAPVEKLHSKENGIILIERLEDSVEFRYEGFTPELELVLRWLVAQIKEKQKVRP